MDGLDCSRASLYHLDDLLSTDGLERVIEDFLGRGGKGGRGRGRGRGGRGERGEGGGGKGREGRAVRGTFPAALITCACSSVHRSTHMCSGAA